jgi:hypothetical protein
MHELLGRRKKPTRTLVHVVTARTGCAETLLGNQLFTIDDRPSTPSPADRRLIRRLERAIVVDVLGPATGVHRPRKQQEVIKLTLTASVEPRAG